MMASYIAPAMIGLILTLALAIRAVACAIGAVASVAKGAGDGRLEAVRARPAAFPCYFPAKPLAGKIFSLVPRCRKLAQRLDLTEKYSSEEADFGAEEKNFPALSLLAGKVSEHAHSEDAIDRVETGQHALADQVAQGFGGAAAQRAVARAAVEARDREFVGEAVAAMHLDGFAGDAQGHLVAISLGDGREQRVGELVGAGAAAVEHAAPDLDVLVTLGDLPAHALKLADRAAECSAFLGIAYRLFERPLGEAQRDARVEASLRVEGRQQFLKAVLAQHQILGRQNAILEADLVQVLAAHRGVRAGDRKAGGAPLDQDAADPLAAGPPVDPGEDDKHLRLVGPADQGLDAVEPERIAGMVDIGRG